MNDITNEIQLVRTDTANENDIEGQREGNRGTGNRQSRRGRGKRNPNKKGEVNIRLLNINGIKKRKFVQLEELFFGEGKGLNMLCLTEVKGTYDRIKKKGG